MRVLEPFASPHEWCLPRDCQKSALFKAMNLHPIILGLMFRKIALAGGGF